MKKLTAAEKRYLDNATLIAASRLIFRKIEEVALHKKRLGELCVVCRGGSPRPKGDPRYFGGHIPWIMISDATNSSGQYIQTTRETVTEEGAKKSRYLEKGTLIVTNSATIGLPKILGVDGCIHDGFLAFLDVSPEISLDFLYWFFIDRRTYLERIAPEGTQKNINTDIARSLEIPLLDQGLQVSICQFLEAVAERKNNSDRFAFPNLPIPFADIPDKIKRIEELAAKVEEARELRSQSFDMLSAVLKSAQRKLIGDQPESNWIPLSQVVTAIKNGKSPSCEKRPATLEEWGVLKVGVVSSGTYNPDENKALPTSIPPNPEYEVQVGDFLMSRANTTELVGSCAVVKETRSKLLLSDKIFRFIFNESADLLPDYLNHVMKSPALRLQIEQEATGTSSSMKNISKQKVFNLLIPDTPLAQQREIVSYLDNLQTKINCTIN